MTAVKVTFEFDNVYDAVQFMNQQEVAGKAPIEQTALVEQPVKKPRKSNKTETPAESPVAAAVGSVAASVPTQAPPVVDNLAALMGGDQPAPAKVYTQKDLITAFVNLGNAKGPAAIKGILSELGAATVNAIPQEKWGEAITKAGG